MNKNEIYRKNQKKAKILATTAPFVFWGLIVLAIFFFIIALDNSVGNLREITSLLNSKKYTGEELRANYLYLTDKYGEWIIGSGSTGFTLTFINVKAAIFGGFAIAMGIMAVVCFVCAFVFGKWLFPVLVQKITQSNQDMVNLTVLQHYDKDK